MSTPDPEEIEREALARAYDPDAFEPHPAEQRRAFAAIQWSARRKLATDAAERAWNHGYRRLSESDSRARLEQVWSALGCASNPDVFRPSVQQAMWDDALSMITNATARDSRVYRENQELTAEVERLRLSESEMRREWGVLGPRSIVSTSLDERSAREWVTAHPHDAVVSRPVGAWTKEADLG